MAHFTIPSPEAIAALAYRGTLCAPAMQVLQTTAQHWGMGLEHTCCSAPPNWAHHAYVANPQAILGCELGQLHCSLAA